MNWPADTDPTGLPGEVRFNIPTIEGVTSAEEASAFALKRLPPRGVVTHTEEYKPGAWAVWVRKPAAERRSISDDDLCASCSQCDYSPGDTSTCSKGWPCELNPDGYAYCCVEYGLATRRNRG